MACVNKVLPASATLHVYPQVEWAILPSMHRTRVDLVQDSGHAVEAVLAVLVNGRELSRHHQLTDCQWLDDQWAVDRRQNDEVALGRRRRCCRRTISAAVASRKLGRIAHQLHHEDRRLRHSTEQGSRRQQTLTPPPRGELPWPVSVFAPLCENITSSTKPEVHNALHCRHRTNLPRRQVMCTENFVNFRHVILEICQQTDIHTYRHKDYNTSGSK